MTDQKQTTPSLVGKEGVNVKLIAKAIRQPCCKIQRLKYARKTCDNTFD